MALTPTDLRMLEALHAHRVLTTALLAQAVGVPLRTANYRLGRLHDQGLVDRIRPWSASAATPLHWWLTRPGRAAIGARGRVRGSGTSPQFLAHTAATAAVALALRDRGPQAGMELLRWVRDADAWEGSTTQGGEALITPDGFALVRHARLDARVPLLVEVDLATMPVTRLREKVRRYLDYAAREVWRERHDQCPMLLVLTVTTGRAGHVLTAVAAERRPFLADLGALLVAVSSAGEDAAGAVTDPVWRSDADDPDAPARTLADLVAYRISTERKRHADDEARRAAAAAAERRALADWVSQTVRTVDRDDVPDPLAWQVLRAVFIREETLVHKWAEGHPSLLAALAGWLQRHPRPPLPAESIAALRAEHPALLAEQTAAARAAAGATGSAGPRLRRACALLAEGQLAPWGLLARPDTPQAFDDCQAEILAPYRRRRDDAVDAALAGRPAWRRTPGRDELLAEHDAEHLSTCDGCGLHQEWLTGTACCANCDGGTLGPYRPGWSEQRRQTVETFLSGT